MQKFIFKGTYEQESLLRAELAKTKSMPGGLMASLQKAQEIYGYLPIEVQKIIAEELCLPLQEVYGVVTFYSQFSLIPSGKNTVAVCLGTACYVKGSGDIMNKFSQILGVKDGETTADELFTLKSTRCIGCCGLAPVLTVNEEVYGKVTVDDVEKIVKKYKN